MSGRSAYVRKQKAPTKEKSSQGHHHHHHHHHHQQQQVQPQLTAQQQLQFQQFQQLQQYQQGQPYVPALNIIDFDYDNSSTFASKSSRHRPRSSNARSGASISSWSSNDGRSPLSTVDNSRIEKSAFRSFIDSKSDAFRNKLSFRSTSSKSSSGHGDGRSVRSEFATQSNYSNRETNGPTFELPASPLPMSPPVKARVPQSENATSNTPGPSLEGSTRFSDQLAAVKRWSGGGKTAQPWAKLRKDPELWDPTGDTLVYLGHEAHGSSRPGPSLRVHSSILEETGSAFFTTILREGFLDRHDFDLPASPASPPLGALPRTDSLRDVQSRSGDRGSDIILPLQQPRVPHAIHSLNGRTGQRTPPDSDSSGSDKDHPVLYELFFPAPLDASKVENLRHHLTTRNVFALLFNKSLVGLNLYQALLDLHERLQMYMPPESDNASLIIDYVVSNGLDDVRSDPASAAGLLAWSEGPAVHWLEGWREAFVHCAGMYSRLRLVPEFRDISHFSRVLLERASLELQVRVQQAAEKLADFDFSDMWPMQSILPPPARASFDRFRRFLVKYYEAVFWSWPPLPRYGTAESWLTRDVAMRLQRDFGALYDYIVDRDMIWDVSEPQNDRKWRIVSKGQKPKFRADSDDLPITDIFLSFDNRFNYPHIPHPFPLVPASRPVQIPHKQPRFGKKAKGSDVKFTERRIALEYSEATNIFVLGSDFAANDFVEAFTRFEKSDQPGEVDPYHARKGRWILLYGILQVLSTIAVDTPNLRFKDGVVYFLNPRLRGTPPWRDKSEPAPAEANHYGSHCWTVPKTWKDSEVNADRAAIRNHREIVIKSGGIGDGSGRAWSDEENATDSTPSLKDNQYSKQWVYNGDGFMDRSGSVSRASNREKVKDWPIKNQASFRPRGVPTSDYVPPEDW